MTRPLSIDLHPDKVPGTGPEAALLACRAFLERCLASGQREARIITGLGLRGDGTPRLRGRVEAEVLAAYARQIEQQSYEQDGAVIHVWFHAQAQAPTRRWDRQHRQQQEQGQVAQREGRLLVAYDRLEAAQEALLEKDLRRFRLKANQVAKEFGWPVLAKELSVPEAETALAELEAGLKKLDT